MKPDEVYPDADPDDEEYPDTDPDDEDPGYGTGC